MNSQIVIGIPGLWKSRKEIVQSISGGYLFAGNILSKVGSNHFFEVEVYEYDSKLSNAFRIGGAGSFSTEQLDEINSHTLTIYLIGKGGTNEDVLSIMEAGCGILKAGGLAVKVESSGVASTSVNWVERFESKNMAEIAKSFVTFVNGGTYFYSCGMHCFGHPDSLVFTDQVSSEYASTLMWTFCMYNIFEKPLLRNNEIFSIDARSQCFILEHSECKHFEREHPFYNPYGLWALVKGEN